MTTTAVNPEPIMRLASGFMAAKHLFAASDLGIFEALADAPTTIERLAKRTGLTVRAARISADAMVAVGMLERDADNYRNTDVAATFLAGSSPADLRPFLRFWDRISYPAWTGLATALGSGPDEEIFDLADDLQEIASLGIEAVLASPTQALPRAVELSDRRRLLDVGGGTGSWSMALVQHYPELSATVLDLPVVADIARRRIADADVPRVSVIAGDALTGDLPAGYDTFLLANLIHYFSPDQNRALLRRVRAVAPPGAYLLLADFWTNTTHTEPVHAALMAGEFAVHLRTGDVYSVDEITTWLTETGWQVHKHLPLAGPISLVVAEA